MEDSAKPAETWLQPFRVFISSPGDVEAERAAAHIVLSRLQSERRYRDRVAFRAVAWDAPGLSVPMRFTETPQISVSRSLGDPSECEVTIVILWSRLGTPLPEKHLKPDGTPYLSGTEWELQNALAGYQRNGKPVILVYRRPEQPPLRRQDPDFKEKLAQQEAVEEFFSGLPEPGTWAIRHGVNDYAEPNELEEQLNAHLRELVEERLGEWLNSACPAEPTAKGGESTRRTAYDKPPFPGLRAFQESDAAVFFGRGP